MPLALTAPDSPLSRVRHAIGPPRKQCAESLAVEIVAKVATMSASAFHLGISRPTRLESDPVPEQILLPQSRQLLIDDAKSASSASAV